MRILRCLGIVLLFACTTRPVVAKADLAIGFDQKTSRPNLFIAWRNTERILEVELEVKNYGDEQAAGNLVVAILDEEGKILDSSPGPANQPIVVSLPPFARGGKEGKIVQMHGSKSLNLLIDRLDRANARYTLKAEILTQGIDANPINNVSVKSFNVSGRARPGSTHFFDYYFKNLTGKPVDLTWKVDSSALPAGWEVSTSPKNGEKVHLEPLAVAQGFATLKTPPSLGEGDHLDLRFAAIDTAANAVFGQSEWFVVYDTTPPEISGLSYTLDNETGLIEVTLTANDSTSMLREASGVRVEYSTDGGVTFSNRVLAYLDGNFVGPTRFRGYLGPFAPDTHVEMSVLVADIAENTAQRGFEPITVTRAVSIARQGGTR